ncbi:hypothetical protein HWV62_35190 [Athelia sp. TMB]|nr:hypothetical protein HWV62_35190 [Athelia sp. TMB]
MKIISEIRMQQATDAPAACTCSVGPFHVANSPASIPVPVSSIYTRNNAPLDPEEETKVRSALLLADRETARINKALLQLKAAQDTLRNQRDLLEVFSSTYAPLVSVLRRLPREILADIFLYLRPDEQSFDSPDLRRTVMLPSHVCRRWREIALSTPELWTTVIFVITPEVDIKRKLDCAKAWITRGRQHFLSVSISCIMPKKSARVWRALLNILVPTCGRWKNAKISTWTSELLYLKDGIPNLESLDIRIGENEIDVFEVAPNLRRLRVRGELRPVEQMRQLKLPWAQLTDCDPGMCSIEYCLELMQAMPCLVAFTVALQPSVAYLARFPGDDERLRMERLSRLSISAIQCKPEQIEELFASITLPELTEFHYSNVQTGLNYTSVQIDGTFSYDLVVESCGWSHAQFIALLTRSSCPIKRLAIRIGASLERQDIAQLLQLTPKLEHLDLSSEPGGKYTSCIRSLLTYSPNAPETCLVPHLKSVVLEDSNEIQCRHVVDGLLLMLESRWIDRSDLDGGIDGPLERIDCVELRYMEHTLPETRPESYRRLRKLIEHGLVVRTVDRGGKSAVFV